MRSVKRGIEPPPACLSAKDKKGKTELDRVREYEAAKKKAEGKTNKKVGKKSKKEDSFGFVAYKGDEVKRRLEELFHGKCAYCESFYSSSAPVDVEHFRPKGRVHGEPDHPGYWWLAMEWDNLLPSCIDCNRRRKQDIEKAKGSGSLVELLQASEQAGKQDYFPIEGKRAQPEARDFTDERALLLNPCHDDPADHLEFYFGTYTPTALVLPKPIDLAQAPDAGGPLARESSVRGATSIQVYGLNRLRLAQDRLRVLRRLEFLQSLVVDLASMADEVESSTGLDPARAADIARRLRDLMDRVLKEIKQMARPDAPYSAMAAAWIQHCHGVLA